MKFKEGQNVKYYKSYHGYVCTTIEKIDLDNDKLITKDGLQFSLNGVELNSAKSAMQKLILELDEL
jgi:hypothetical protein